MSAGTQFLDFEDVASGAFHDEQNVDCVATTYVDGDIKFYPPAYIQRYDAVKKVLLDERWKSSLKKVADLGCGELSLFFRLKELLDINKILMVDVDKALLEGNASKAAPLNCDYLCPRATPLSVDVLCGSVADHDVRLLGCDAVTCVEIIEHLEEDIVGMLVTTVFGFIQPQIAIFTTPNADFNVLFKNFEGFRHWDHKFEWTRAEFKTWTENVLACYPHYKVEIQGIGNPPLGKEAVGHCSQMAIFIRDKEYIPPCVEGAKEIYSMIRSYEHPVKFPDVRSDEERLRDEVMYMMHNLAQREEYHIDNDDIYIPLSHILPLAQQILPNIDEHMLHQALIGQVKVLEFEGEQVVHYNYDQNDTDEDPNEDPYDDVYDDLEDINDPPADYENLLIPAEQDLPLVDFEDENYQSFERSRAIAHQVKAIHENYTNLAYERQRDDFGLIYEGESLDGEESEDYESDYDDLYWQPADCERAWNSVHKPCPVVDKSGEQAPHGSCVSREEENDGWFDDAEELQKNSETVSSPSAILDSKREPITDSGVDLSPLLASAPPSEDDLQDICCRLNYTTPGIKEKVFHKSTSIEVLHVDGPSHSKRPEGLEYVERKVAVCYTGQTYCRADTGDSCSIDNDRAGDSGYPNSCSLHLDLTPEQVDDISSENGERSNQTLSDDEVSDASDALDLPVRPLQPHVPVIPIIFEDVENGDLANNNRDGEGNNAVAVVEDERVFEALVREGEMQPLMAVPDASDVVLPNNADPYPEWLSDLLGMCNVSKVNNVSTKSNSTPSDSADQISGVSKCRLLVCAPTMETTSSISAQPLLDTSLVKSEIDEGLGDDTVCWASEAESDDKLLDQ